MILREGVGTPHCRVYYRTGTINGQDKYALVASWDQEDPSKPWGTEFVRSFKYKSTENQGDECTVEIGTSNRAILDKPWAMAGAQLKVIWGYREGSMSKPKLLEVKTIKPSFTTDGITLTIIAVDRASELRESRSKEVHEAPSGNPNDKFTFSDVAIKFCREKGLILKLWGQTWDFRQKAPNNNSQSNSSQPMQLNRTLMDQIKAMGRPAPGDIDTIKKDPGISYQAYPQANKSDYLLLKEMLTQQDNGPHVIKSTDNVLEIDTRNLDKKPVYGYTWNGGSGELLGIDGKFDTEYAYNMAGNIQGDYSDNVNKVVGLHNSNSLVSGDTALGDSVMAYLSSYFTSARFFDNTVQYVVSAQIMKRLSGKVAQKLAQRAVTATVGEGLLAGLFGVTFGWEIWVGMIILDQMGLVPSASIEKLFEPGPDTPQKIYDPKYNQIPSVRDAYSNVGKPQIPQSFKDKLGTPHSYDENFRDLSEVIKSNITGSQFPFQNHLHTAETDPVAFKNVLDNYQKEKAMEAIEFDLETMMHPRIESGDIIRLGGIGTRLAGNYYISEIIHTLDSNGAINKLTVKKNAVNPVKSEESGQISSDEKVIKTNRTLDEEDTNIPYYNNIFKAQLVNGQQVDPPSSNSGWESTIHKGPVYNWLGLEIDQPK